MLKWIPFLAVVAIITTGCVRQERPTVGVTAKQAAQNRAKPYVEGVAALARYKAGSGCNDPQASTVKQKITELQNSVKMFHGTGFYAYERQSRDRHTNLAFGFADEALKKKCLDDADATYRELIYFYTGAAYAGIRDRAKLGIDDVRAARSQTSKK